MTDHAHKERSAEPEKQLTKVVAKEYQWQAKMDKLNY